jgi:hypothetical protein
MGRLQERFEAWRRLITPKYYRNDAASAGCARCLHLKLCVEWPFNEDCVFLFELEGNSTLLEARTIGHQKVTNQQLIVLEATASHTIGTWRNFALVIWRRETVLAGLIGVRTQLTELSKRYPKNVCLMQIIEKNGAAPEPVVRTAIADTLTSFREHIIGSSIIFEESGFKAAVVRAVVSGVTLLAKFGFPHVVFSAVGEASVWHARLGKANDFRPGELVDAVEKLRRTPVPSRHGF